VFSIAQAVDHPDRTFIGQYRMLLLANAQDAIRTYGYNTYQDSNYEQR